MSKTTVKRKIDTLFSQIIRERGKCEHCGKTDNLQAAHIFSRSNMAVRWSFENVLCLCAGCHFWAHKNPILFVKWVEEYIGNERFVELSTVAVKIRKWTEPEMVEFHLLLKEQAESTHRCINCFHFKMMRGWKWARCKAGAIMKGNQEQQFKWKDSKGKNLLDLKRSSIPSLSGCALFEEA